MRCFQAYMTPYELSNNQRQYFGLNPVDFNWERKVLNKKTTVYFNGNKIEKILDYSYGYHEYDVDIETIEKQILLPKTSRGKSQTLTVPRILKIKGSAVEFSGSFLGGGIRVYDNKRNVCFIASYQGEGSIERFQDIDNWITNYTSNLPEDYFDWLDQEG